MENSGESQLRQSRATQPTVHAGYVSVSIIHRPLTWSTGSLTRAQMLMHAIANGRCTDTVRESALKADSGRKIPCPTGERTYVSAACSGVPARRSYQLSYIPAPGNKTTRCDNECRTGDKGFDRNGR